MPPDQLPNIALFGYAPGKLHHGHHPKRWIEDILSHLNLNLEGTMRTVWKLWIGDPTSFKDKGVYVYVYTDASDNACRAQLSQEHHGMEFPIAFLSHTFIDIQRKWSTTEQEACGVYYAVIKWNYYLQGANIIVCNDHKPIASFLNGKNANNNMNIWGLELATYKITFEWISGTPKQRSWLSL